MRNRQEMHQEPQVTVLFAAYLAARYRWGQGAAWHAVKIGRLSPEIEAAFPDAAEFGMLSAWNPFSVPQPEGVNRAADDAMQAALEDRCVIHRPAFAAASNRTWREPNWVVVDLPVVELDALAKRFGQLGTLHWQQRQPVRLRMYAAKPTGLADHPHVDWLE